MKTAIVTDTNSGIFPEEGTRLGIFVLPMPVILDDQIRYEGINLSVEQFYQALSEGRSVSSSQPSLGDVLLLWDGILEEYDELVYIPMSSGLSSACRTAQGLSKEYGGRVQVADNHRISVSLKSSALDAKALADAGCTAVEIKEELERTAYDAITYVGVETLEYLKRSGRVMAAGAALGTMLNIKPLLKIEGERLDAYAKVRGTANCRKRLIQAIEESIEAFCKRGWNIHIGLADSFTSPAAKEEWLSTASELLARDDIEYSPLTCSIGSHTGANAFGMAVSRRITG